MAANRRHPQDVAVWQIDEETGEVTDSDHYTNWPDQ